MLGFKLGSLRNQPSSFLEAWWNKERTDTALPTHLGAHGIADPGLLNDRRVSAVTKLGVFDYPSKVWRFPSPAEDLEKIEFLAQPTPNRPH